MRWTHYLRNHPILLQRVVDLHIRKENPIFWPDVCLSEIQLLYQRRRKIQTHALSVMLYPFGKFYFVCCHQSLKAIKKTQHLLRYNLRVIEFTHVECTIQCILILMPSCAALTAVKSCFTSVWPVQSRGAPCQKRPLWLQLNALWSSSWNS